MEYVIVTDYNGQNISVKVTARVSNVIEKFDALEEQHELEMNGDWIIRLDEQGSDQPPKALQEPSAEDVYFDLLCQEIREQYVNNYKIYYEPDRDGIEHILNTCSPLQKERFLLYIKENLTLDQIAERQDCNLSSVHRSVKKVLKKIANSL